MAHEIGNGGFHEGFQQPISGSREVDLRGRKIQEAAERLSVSTDENEIKTESPFNLQDNNTTR